MGTRGRWSMLLPLMLAPPLQAAEWQASLPAAEASTPQVERVLPLAGGYRLVGSDAEGRTLWADGAGASLRWRQPEASGLDGLVPERARLVPAGGARVLGVARAGEACRWVHFDAQGELAAQAALPTCLGGESSAGYAATVDALGVLWAARPNTVETLRLGADGEALPLSLPADASAAFAFSALRLEGGAYALYRRGDLLQAARLDDRGSRWTWRPETDDVHLLALQTAGNDDLWLVGRAGPRFGAGQLYVARLAPTGALRWQRRYADLGPALIVTLQALPGDRLAIASLPALGAQHEVVVLAPSGDPLLALAPAADSAFAGFVEQPADAPMRPAGPFALFLGTPPAAGSVVSTPRIGAIDYRDGAGARIALLSTFGADEDRPLTAVLDDGSLLHVDSDRSSRTQQLRHFGPDGRSRAAPPLRGSLLPVARRLASHVAADGESFVLLQVAEAAPLQLAAYAVDGRLRWSTPLGAATAAAAGADGTLVSSQMPQLASNSERVCLGPLRLRFSQVFVSLTRVASAVNCVRRADGELLFTRDTVPGTVGDLLPPIALTDDHRVLLLEAGCAECVGPRQLQRVALDPLGEVLSRQDLLPAAESFFLRRTADGVDGVEAVAELAADGSGRMVYTNTRRELIAQPLAAFGQPVPPSQTLAAAPAGWLLGKQGLVGDALLLHRWEAGLHKLEVYDPSSRILWTRELAGPLQAADGSPPLLFAVAGDRVLLLEQAVSAGRRNAALLALDARSGAVRWRHELAALDARGVKALAVDAASQRALLLRERPGALLLQVHALADGRERGLRRLPCAAGSCSSATLHPAGNDALIAVTRSGLARVDLAAAERAAPLRQAALRGTWFDPATDGQGLLLDFSPASGDLLGAWFTYADGATRGVDGLSWYTFAGAVPAQGTRAVLTLFRNSGGRFATPPVTDSVAVGEVALVLRGCNALQVDYRFTAGALAGRGSSSMLQRLSPATADCLDGDGSVVAGAATAGNRQALARAGAWFAPATAGQGLLFDLRPATADGRDRGLLLGGWFTYDVEAAVNDADAQHWFQLQGLPDDASGDRQRGVIFRASNGGLDARPTRNVHAVGEVELRFEGCERAQLDYRFDGSALAGPFAGRAGSLALIKLLPCEP